VALHADRGQSGASSVRRGLDDCRSPRQQCGGCQYAYWVSQAQTNYPSINPALFQVWTPENSSGVIDLTVAQPDMVDSSAVPEPAAFTLTGIALIGFAWRRKSAR